MHPLRLLSLVIAVLLAGTTLAAASSLDTAIARFTGTTDGRSAYIQAVEVRFGTAKESNAGRARIERLLLPLTQAAQLDPPLVVVTARDGVNAYALPGLVVVHRGTLTLVTDDDELSVLLAHELGHIALNHPLRGISPGAPHGPKRLTTARKPSWTLHSKQTSVCTRSVRPMSGQPSSCHAQASPPQRSSPSGIILRQPASPTIRTRIPHMRNGSRFTAAFNHCPDKRVTGYCRTFI